MRVCRRFETDFHVGRAVGAKPLTVRRRMRRYGILKWPARRKGQKGHQRGQKALARRVG